MICYYEQITKHSLSLTFRFHQYRYLKNVPPLLSGTKETIAVVRLEYLETKSYRFRSSWYESK